MNYNKDDRKAEQQPVCNLVITYLLTYSFVGRSETNLGAPTAAYHYWFGGYVPKICLFYYLFITIFFLSMIDIISLKLIDIIFL